MEQHPSLLNQSQDEGLNIREQIDVYLAQWKWFLLSIFLCTIIALIYLRYAVPEYSATATILVKDERKGGIQSELTAFSDLGLMSGVKSNVDNEIEVIKSRTIIEKAIKKLGLTVSYFTEGRVKSVERYTDNPLNFNFIDVKPNFYIKTENFTINTLSKQKFEIINSNGKKNGDYSFGDTITLENCKLIVTKNALPKFMLSDEFSVYITIDKLLNVVQKYKSKMNITTLGKNTSVVELTLNDPIKEKAQDLLDQIILIYNQDAVDDKNFISKKTEDFIDNRIKLIAQELGDVEKGEENFKTENKVTDIATESGLYLQNAVDFQKELIQTETQISVANTLTDFMKTKPKGELLPSNIVPYDENASGIIAEFNKLVLERNRIAKEAMPKSPILINFDQKISELNESVKESLSRLKTSLNIKKGDLQKQISLVGGRISTIPSKSRKIRIIERQQQIKESLYLYLLQKREETAITLAVTAPNAKVIDTALASNIAVSPKRNMIFLAAIAFGLLIPFLIIYIRELLDTKIKSRQDVEGKVSIPFIGDIPKSSSNEEIINTNSRSSSAEAIRIVRTNLEFMLGQAPENKAKTIFVTSTIPKEGKTFISINLASTIALSGKKVLLIGLDIRNPKLDNYVNLPSKGLTNFLAKTNENINDYIVKLDKFDNLYVLPSGTIPPNPVELLMNNKVNQLFDTLKDQYDYIVVDTAPVGVVTDTLLIAKNADSFIYVMRANYLDKRMLKVAESFYKEKRLPNMAILLNDTIWKKTYGYGYSYGYGYGDHHKKKSFFSNFLKKNFKD